MVGTLALLAAGSALAGGYVVVRTSDLAPYKAVEAAYTSELGQPVQSVNLASKDAKLRQAMDGATAVLAIGPDAAKAVDEVRPSAPVLLTLVPNGEKAVSAELKAKVVPMFVPAQRQAKVIRSVLPSAKRIGVIYDPTQSKALVAELDAAASSVGLTLLREEVTARKEVIGAVRTLVGRVDVLWLVPDATVLGTDTIKFMVQTSIQSKVPLVGFSQGLTKAGALLSVEAEFDEMGKKAAQAVRKGPGTQPEAPQGKIYLNARSAELLGISIPSGVRSQAARVFE